MPTLTLSIAALRAAGACDLDERIADLRTVRPDVAEDEAVPLAVWWALSTTSIPDRWWSLRVAQPTHTARQVAVRGAALAARRVLHLTRHADRKACEAAIVAAEAWADQPTAVAAGDAAYAADAAAAASRATAYSAAAAAAAAATWAAAAAASRAASRATAYSAAGDAYAAAVDAAYAAEAAVDAATVDADAYADAVAAERSAQRADLDRLLMETSR